MTDRFVAFDEVRTLVREALRSLPDDIPPCYVVRDLYGRVRVVAPETGNEDSAARRDLLELFARRLHSSLGRRAYPVKEAVLFVDPAALNDLREFAQEIQAGVRMVDRLVTGRNWWTIGTSDSSGEARRFALFFGQGRGRAKYDGGRSFPAPRGRGRAGSGCGSGP